MPTICDGHRDRGTVAVLTEKGVKGWEGKTIKQTDITSTDLTCKYGLNMMLDDVCFYLCSAGNSQAVWKIISDRKLLTGQQTTFSLVFQTS